MRQIDWYLDEAKRRLNLSSDHELSAWLGRSRGLVTQWRTRRNWPKDPMMVQLAHACGVDPRVALAELASWKEPSVQQWRDLVQLLTSVGAGAVLIATLLVPGFGAHPASASELAASLTVYYGKWRRVLAGMRKRLISTLCSRPCHAG